MTKKLLIIDWDERYRNYVLQAGRELSLELYLTLRQPDPKAAPHVADMLILPDLYVEPKRWINTIIAYIKQNKIDGVFTHEDELTELAALVCEGAGLPTASSESVRTAMDKWAARERLTAASIPGPAYRQVISLTEARHVIAEIGLPVVIKPVSCSGGNGASKIESIEALEGAWQLAYRASREVEQDFHQVIIEEFLEGPLISVETVVVDGEPIPTAMTDALQETAKDGAGNIRFVYHGLIVPSRAPEDMKAEMMKQTVAAIKALKIETGVMHIEFKCTPSRCRIVEMNPRLPGVFIPELVYYATGVKLAQAALLLALGQRPDLEQRCDQGACVRLFIAQSQGTVQSITGFDQVKASPHVVRAQCWVSVGDRVFPPQIQDIESRLGYVMTHASTPKRALTAAEQAMEQLSLVIRTE